jgi:hypothetical protein
LAFEIVEHHAITSQNGFEAGQVPLQSSRGLQWRVTLGSDGNVIDIGSESGLHNGQTSGPQEALQNTRGKRTARNYAMVSYDGTSHGSVHSNMPLAGIHPKDQIESRGGQTQTESSPSCLGMTNSLIAFGTVKKSEQRRLALTVRMLSSNRSRHSHGRGTQVPAPMNLQTPSPDISFAKHHPNPINIRE